MGSDTAVACAWVGTVLINIGFVILITWSSELDVLYGFVISLVYTIVLFGMAYGIDKKFDGDRSTPNNDVIPETTTGTASSPHERRFRSRSISILISLLYGVAVIALGVTGFLLPLKIFSCPYSPYPNYSPYDPNVIITNYSSFPNDVMDWYALQTVSEEATFAYLPFVDTLVYRGSDGSHFAKYNTPTTRLWKKVGSQKPELLSQLYYPREFTIMNITDGASTNSAPLCCFLASRRVNHTRRTLLSVQPRTPTLPEESAWDEDYDIEEDTVACTDGYIVKVVREGYFGAKDVFGGSDGRLYFRADRLPEDDTYGYYFSNLIYSLNVTTMDVTQHSHIKKYSGGENDNDDSQVRCDYGAMERKRSSLSIATSIIPVIAISLLIFLTKKITTMPITFYMGLSALTIAITVSATANYQSILPDVLKWWFATTTVVWLYTLFVLRLTHRIKREILSWSFNFCALGYFASLLVLINIPFSQYTNDAWRWVLMNIVNFIPLIMIGVITEFILMVLLGAIGFFMDSWKIGSEIAELVGGDVLVYFFTFSITGIGMGYFGWLLNRHQKKIQRAVDNWAGRWLHCLMKEEEVVNETTNEGVRDDGETGTEADSTVIADGISTGVGPFELEMRESRPID